MKLKPEDIDRIAAEVNAVHNLKEGSSTARIIVHMGTRGIARPTPPAARAECFHIDNDPACRLELPESSPSPRSPAEWFAESDLPAIASRRQPTDRAGMLRLQ